MDQAVPASASPAPAPDPHATAGEVPPAHRWSSCSSRPSRDAGPQVFRRWLDSLTRWICNHDTAWSHQPAWSSGAPSSRSDGARTPAAQAVDDREPEHEQRPPASSGADLGTRCVRRARCDVAGLDRRPDVKTHGGEPRPHWWRRMGRGFGSPSPPELVGPQRTTKSISRSAPPDHRIQGLPGVASSGIGDRRRSVMRMVSAAAAAAMREAANTPILACSTTAESV
jgi:hypothetical protein